jgi:acyl-CoA thioester hydrolase
MDAAACEAPRVEGYNFSTEILVRFAETDAQGIAHHASFVVWLEVARIAYLAEHAGGYLSIQAQGIEALTTGVDVRYHRAAYFDDRLRVWARCVDIRGARFRYEYAVERAGELIAEGSTSHATVDAAARLPTRVPAWFAEAVARAEAPARDPA